MKGSEYRQQRQEELRAALETSPEGAEAANAATLVPEGPDQWAGQIAVLAKPDADPADRLTALQLLKAASFGRSAFDPCRPAFTAALRQAAKDGDEDLRRAALDILANRKDEAARAMLIAGLENEAEALVPPAVALGLLASDDHSAAISFARRFLESDAGRHIKEQAVHLLAADPGCRDLLTRLMADKEQFKEVRRASAAALRHIDPDAFIAHARQILADSSDFKEIRATLQGAFERAGIELPHAHAPGPVAAAATSIVSRVTGWFGGLFKGRNR